MDCPALTVGVLSTAKIARKNLLAIAHTDAVKAVCVGSRDAARAQQFAEETGLTAVASYDAVLSSAVDAVYVPLPTALHAEWVSKAAAAGKHVLCEKPVARSASELAPLLNAFAERDLVFMDGVMFRHHTRLDAMQKAIRGGALGAAGARHVSSAFAFRGDAAFLRDNIRVKVDGDPLGCLGDLGWYCVGLSLWAFGYDLPARASATVHAQTSEGVPLHMSCTLTWTDDPGSGSSSPASQGLGPPPPPRTATFFCSFLHAEQQWAHIAGDEGVIEMEDFVIPFQPSSASFSVKKHVWGENALAIDRQVRTEETAEASAQEVRMWECFAAECKASDDGRDGSRAFWRSVAMKTQVCMDALLASAAQNGASVEVADVGTSACSGSRNRSSV